MKPGLIHIYTGKGKGKTTAAIGLGIRANGNGAKILMVQFLKGRDSGEKNIILKLAPSFQLYQGKSIVKFTNQMNEAELLITAKNESVKFDYAINEAINGKYDMLILDEIMAAVNHNFINIGNVIEFLKNKPLSLEVVLTGRNAPASLIELADYVSEIKAIKHPFENGIPARKGIEY